MLILGAAVYIFMVDRSFDATAAADGVAMNNEVDKQVRQVIRNDVSHLAWREEREAHLAREAKASEDRAESAGSQAASGVTKGSGQCAAVVGCD